MSYTITHTDGTFLGNINDGQADGINNTAPGNPTYPLTNLVLFGRNYSGYGLPMNDNFVTLLENSASNTPPLHPLKGQLWFDKGNVALNVYSGTSWGSVSAGTPSATPLSNPRVGQLWWDTTNQVLKVWSGTSWTTTGSGGNANVTSQTATITVLDNLSNPHIVTTITVNGSVTTVLSSDPVFLTSDTQITGFGTVGPGINILPTNLYYGSLASGTTVSGSTPVVTDNSSLVATTAFVQEVANIIVAGGAGVSTFNTRAGNVTLLDTDVVSALGYTPVNAAPVGFAYSNGSAWLSSYASTGTGNVVLDTNANISATNLSVTNTIVGNITGSAGSSTYSNNSNVSAVSGNGPYHLVFVDNSSGIQPLEATAGITANAAASSITATTFNGNLSGNSNTATNLFGPALLPDGTTATTQIAGDSSGNIATTNFVHSLTDAMITGVSQVNGHFGNVTLDFTDITNSLGYTPVNKAGDTVTGNLVISGLITVTGGVDKLTTATGNVSVSAATAPTVGQVLTATSATEATWQTPSGGSSTNFSIVLTNINAGSVVIGTPVYIASAGNIDQAQANAAATVNVIGLVADTSIASSATGHVYINGVLTATTGQWDAVTGQTGGLVPGQIYYLSNTTSGMLSNVSPTLTGNFVAPVGIAINSTDFKINVQTTIQI